MPESAGSRVWPRSTGPGVESCRRPDDEGCPEASGVLKLSNREGSCHANVAGAPCDRIRQDHRGATRCLGGPNRDASSLGLSRNRLFSISSPIDTEAATSASKSLRALRWLRLQTRMEFLPSMEYKDGIARLRF